LKQQCREDNSFSNKSQRTEFYGKEKLSKSNYVDKKAAQRYGDSLVGHRPVGICTLADSKCSLVDPVPGRM
jgi:hypothetical protein